MARCLLIDQDAQERARLGSLFSSLGYDCVEKKAADEGLSYCNAENPDVVVMVASRQQASRDFLRLARNKNSESGRPIVFVYAEKASTDTIGESIIEGAADFLMKPFDRDILRFKLAQAGLPTP
jgi:two-component system, chemotaxis family, chemotaxis protein CheY